MDIHKCYTCSIGIYNMTTIVAILISVKDHLFPTLRQIESKLGWRVRGNMEIQTFLNHSILISNLAPMATICSKYRNTTEVAYCVPCLHNMLPLS